MKVQVAVISTESGIDVVYVGKSLEGAEAAVAKYCREYWEHEGVDLDTEVKDPSTLSDHETIQLYFDCESIVCEGETCEITEEEVQE